MNTTSSPIRPAGERRRFPTHQARRAGTANTYLPARTTRSSRYDNVRSQEPSPAKHPWGLFSRSCPPEILLGIFDLLMHDALGDEIEKDGRDPLLALAEQAGHVHAGSVSSIRQIYNLSQVSSQWREAVLRSSSLWSRIRVPVFGPPDAVDKDHGGQLPMDVCLQFSRKMPLTVFLATRSHHTGKFEDEDDVIQHYGKKYTDAFVSAIRPLLNNCYRWKNIRIDSHICTSMSDTKQIKLRNMPMLEKLSIRSPLDIGRQGALCWIDLNQSPKLETLHLNGDFLLKKMSIKFDKLRSVQLFYRDARRKEFPSVQDFMMLMDAAPRLEVMQVDISSEDVPTERVKIHSSTMKVFSLRVNDESDEAARFLLDCCTFPNLLTLDLDIGRGEEEGDGPQQHILEFLKRSNAPLETFVLSSAEIDEEYIYPMLELMPELVSLWFADFLFSESFIDRMTLSKKAEKNYCPLLEQLSFNDCTLTSEPLEHMGAMALMVLSRRYGVEGRLEEFTMSNSGWKGFQRYEIMQSCVANGLKLDCT